jgi:hypothetical protein
MHTIHGVQSPISLLLPSVCWKGVMKKCTQIGGHTLEWENQFWMILVELNIIILHWPLNNLKVKISQFFSKAKSFKFSWGRYSTQLQVLQPWLSPLLAHQVCSAILWKSLKTTILCWKSFEFMVVYGRSFVFMAICGRSFMSMIVSMKSFESIAISVRGPLSP